MATAKRRGQKLLKDTFLPFLGLPSIENVILPRNNRVAFSHNTITAATTVILLYYLFSTSNEWSKPLQFFTSHF